MSPRSSLLQILASDMRIQTSRLPLPVKTSADFPDLGLRTRLLGKSACFEEELPPADDSGGRQKIWMLRDSFRCHYFLSVFPGTGQAMLLGPYVTEDMTLTDISRRLERIGLKNADLQFLSRYYSTLPRIRDENLLYSILHSHCLEIYGPEGFEIAYWEMGFTRPQRSVAAEPGKEDFQRDALEYVYAQEKRMMDCLSRGNLHGVLASLQRLERKGVESRTTSTMRDMKNFSIVLNTLCRVAAREGGVHPHDIDRLSRSLSIQIENAASYKELMAIREPMLREYCALVRAVRQQTCSPAVQQAKDLIEARFSGHLSLPEVAEELRLSPGYLSQRFRQETGKPFSEYLTETRIAYARQLLERTDLPIASVAAECGIPDNNYFARVFRRAEGVSPREYRLRAAGRPDPA